MGTQVTQTVTIKATSCGECGVRFGLDATFMARRQDDGRSFYCPNGHFISWKAANKAEREQQRLEREKQQLRNELDAARSLARREAERRQRKDYEARAAKGQLTKTRKRIAAGVCPCCNRTFQNLARHIAGQHPEFAGGEQ